MDRRTLLKFLTTAPVIAAFPLALGATGEDRLTRKANLSVRIARRVLDTDTPSMLVENTAMSLMFVRDDELEAYDRFLDRQDPTGIPRCAHCDKQARLIILDHGRRPSFGNPFRCNTHGPAGFPCVPVVPERVAREDAIHTVHLAGEGGWLDDVDIRETLLGVLTECERFGIVEGSIRVRVKNNHDDGVFVSSLLTTPDRAVSCDLVTTWWLAARERFTTTLPKCVMDSIHIRVQVRDAVTQPFPVLRFIRRSRPGIATATLTCDGPVLEGRV